MLVVALLVSNGCDDGLVEIRGVVTLDGEPLQAATVTFADPRGKGRPAGGFTDENGQFLLTSFRPQDGVPPGDYRVTVTKVADGEDFQTNSASIRNKLREAYAASRPTSPYYPNVKNVLPWIYGDPQQTPFRCVVPPTAPVTFGLDSTRSGPVRPR